MRKTATLCHVALPFLLIAAVAWTLSAAEPPTPDSVAKLKSAYETERAFAEKAGLAGKFSPDWFSRAAELAKRGDAAAAAERLTEAAELYRRAGAGLPTLPPDLPDNVARIFGDLRFRHAAGVSAVAFSPDGGRIVSAGSDGVVIVWDAETGRSILQYKGHKQPVTALAFLPGGKGVASAGGDEVKFWDVATGKDLATPAAIKFPSDRIGDSISSLAISPDGRLLLIGGLDNAARTVTLADGKVKDTLKGHNLRIRDVAFSADGKLAATVSEDSHVKIWTAATGALQLGTPVFSKGAVTCVAFTADGTQVFVGGGPPNVVKLLALPDGVLKQTYDGATREILCLAVSPDGKTIAAGGEDKTVKLWDVQSGRCLRTLQGHTEAVTSLAFSPDGQKLVTGSQDQTIRVWEVAAPGQRRSFVGCAGAVWGVSFAGDRRLGAGGADKKLHGWDANTGKEDYAVAGHSAPITAVAASPDGKFFLTCGGDKTLKLWESATGKEVRSFIGHTGVVTAAAFSPDGREIVSVSGDHSARIWDVETAKARVVFPASQSVLIGVAWSGDGKRIATCGGDRLIRLWDPATAKEERSPLSGHTGAVNGVAFSPDGKRLASCGSDHKVLLWNLEVSPTPPPTACVGHTGVVSAVTFSPDGKRVASAGGDNMVKLWDATTRQEVHSFQGRKDWIAAVAFSPDGRYLAASSADGAVEAWELGGPSSTVTLGHSRDLRAVAVSPDGKLLATGGADRSVRIWEIASGRELFTLPGHGEEITALSFLADSKTLVSAGQDKLLKVWDAVAGKELRTFSPALDDVPLVLAPQAAGTTFSVWVARNQITTFDAATGRTLATFSAYDKPEQVTSLAFSVDGGLAAVGLKDGTVRIWDVAKKEKVGADMPAHPGPIADLIFTPDGKTLVTGDGKGDVAIWDLTATPRANKLRFKAHPSALAGFAMSPDGSRFVTFGVDNVVKLWETATAKELRSWDFKLPPLALRPFVRMVVFTPDGKQLATADADTTAYLLDCPSK